MRTPTFELHRSPAAFIAVLEVDSQRSTVAVSGTKTTFTNSAVFTETASAVLAKVRWGFLTGTNQADDWNLAIARLIERIRLADRRMTAPS
jgi:hypothetical protein